MSDQPTSKKILLKCPTCRRQQLITRLEIDYPEAVRIEIPCDDCDIGDFAEISYFDAEGKHITRDPEAV